ncbi:MAG: winged helix-turn-helix domain-containing protein [Bacteroidales bacterium]
MRKKLDPLLHNELRLAIVSLLVKNGEADFIYLKEKTKATSGNLSVQLDKLSEAGYISIKKEFKGKKPHTTCIITQKGIEAFEKYVQAIRDYLDIYSYPMYKNYRKSTPPL